MSNNNRYTDEQTNRLGHWVREFQVPKEPWPVFEHWAAENQYRLIALRGALRGNRRLYRKLSPLGGYTTYIDVKRHENRLYISTWIETALYVRMLTFFSVPRIMTAEPHGFWGVRVRRKICREINQLLFRFRKAPISGSENFHPADFHLTTIAMAALFWLPIVIFLGKSFYGIEIVEGLSPRLLSLVGKHLVALFTIGAFVLAAHHMTLRLWTLTRARIAGITTGAVLVYTLGCVLVMTHSSKKWDDEKFGHYCLQYHDENQCSNIVGALPDHKKKQLLDNIHELEKHF